MGYIDDGYLRGSLGGLVHRKVNNKNIVQTKSSSRTKQSRWTVAASVDFGKASKAGSLIRRTFKGLHMGFHDSNMHNRLITHLKRVMRANGQYLGQKTIHLGKLDRLVNFQFNEKCHMHDFLYFDPTLNMQTDHQLQIQFPSFNTKNDLFRPPYTHSIRVKIGVGIYNFDTHTLFNIVEKHLDLDLIKGPIVQDKYQFLIDCKASKAHSAIVAMSIEYYGTIADRFILLNHRELHPTTIIGAFAI